MAVIHLPQFFDHKNVPIRIPIAFFGVTVGKDQYIVYFPLETLQKWAQ